MQFLPEKKVKLKVPLISSEISEIIESLVKDQQVSFFVCDFKMPLNFECHLRFQSDGILRLY